MQVNYIVDDHSWCILLDILFNFSFLVTSKKANRSSNEIESNSIKSTTNKDSYEELEISLSECSKVPDSNSPEETSEPVAPNGVNTEDVEEFPFEEVQRETNRKKFVYTQPSGHVDQNCSSLKV